MSEPEQTDHRAEAERWLAEAGRLVARDQELQAAASINALIGIGHALLALGQVPTTIVHAPNHVGSNEDLKEALYEQLRQQGLHPPLSPSEGR